MPEFIFTSPEGQKYRVRGPEGATQEDAFAMLQQQMKQQPSQPTAPQQGFFASEMEKAMNAPGDIGRMVLKGATLGQEAKPEDAADRANAALAIGRRFARGRNAEQPAATPQDYRPMFDAERKAVADAEARSGWAGTAAQAVGVLAPATAANKVVQGVAGAVSAVPGIGRVAANPYTQAAATGAGLGVMGAAGTDKNLTEEALLGAGLGVVGQGAANAIVGGVSRAAGLANPKVKIPTVDDLKASSQAAYKAADDAGVIVRPEAMAGLRSRIEARLAEESWTPEASPQLLGFLRGLSRADGENVTLKGLDKLRSNLQTATREGGDNTRRIGGAVVLEIDDFLSNVKPADILTGDAKLGVDALNKAREQWTRQAKGSKVAEALGAADLRAASTGSGGNVDNATRQNLRRLLESGRNWTADERAALETIVRGTPGQNALRLAGKLSPSGNGLMAALGLGATAANPAMVAAPLAGMAAKAAADRMTQSNVKKLADIIAVGGKESATRAPLNKVQQLTQQQRESLARALMGALVFNGGAVPANR